MQALIYCATAIAMLYWVGFFWFRVGRWVYLHGRAQSVKTREAYRRVIQMKDAAIAAYREEP
jgi:hypothetical protein